MAFFKMSSCFCFYFTGFLVTSAMTSTVYEYGTPCLGGYVHGKQIFLTFSHWGVQSIDCKSNHILSTWNRPSTKSQFTCPITYSNDHKWLISSVFHKDDNKSKLILWNSTDLDLKNKSMDVPSTCELQESEFIIRIFHSVICHHWFIIVTNLGNIILFDPNQKIFDYKANQNKNHNSNLVHVKLHDAISSSGYHKQLTHLSFVYASDESHKQQMQIIPISFNAKANALSVHDAMQLTLPKNVCFYDSDSESQETVIDYDWCLDTNHVLLLMNDGTIKCLEYAQAKNSKSTWKYKLKYNISMAKHLDTSAMNTIHRSELKDANVLYAMHDTALLSFIRIKFIESSQFIVVGPSNQEYNTLKLWTFEAEHGFIRDEMTLVAQSIESKLLMIAPIVSIIKHQKSNSDHMQSIDVYAITSKQAVYVRLPSLGRSLLDLVEISLKNECKMEDEEVTVNDVARIQRFLDEKDWNDARMLVQELEDNQRKMEQNAFSIMMEQLVENGQWELMRRYFVLIEDHNETQLLYLLSLMMSHVKYCGEDEAFVGCLNAILSAKMNDIFMKRCIQILPSLQVEELIKYLCDAVDGKRIDIEVIISWFNIILDAHLATLAFSEDGTLYEKYILKIRHCLLHYDQKMKSMMRIQANIHSILNGMKVEYNNKKQKNNLKNRNNSKHAHGMGGGAFAFNTKINNNENDPNLYKDYVVEYIKL
eukprot:722788_1